MTVAAALALGGHEMEYILAVEGIGWPEDEFDLSQGFNGDVFVVDDLNGDLASVLGCTIHKGMTRPTSVSDSFNPRTMAYTPGSTRFEIIDVDGILLSTVKPLWTSGTQGTLSSALNYDATSVVTVEQWAANDVVWVAGREAIKLGTESGGGPYTYASSKRGYLGTPRGRHDHRPTALAQFAWESGTELHDYNRHWYDRRCILFMHVPGETVGNCVRVYTGRVRGASIARDGTVWVLPASDDITTRIRQMRVAQTQARVSWTEFVDESGRRITMTGIPVTAQGDWGVTPGSGGQYNTPSSLAPELAPSSRRAIRVATGSDSWYEAMAVAAAYNYRNRVPGGTAGMRTAATSTPTTPQAVTDADGRYRLDSYMMIDGNYVRALHKRVSSSEIHQLNEVMTEVTSYEFGSDYRSLVQEDGGGEIRFLLDNYSDDIVANRFTLNNEITRNPVDVLLMFLTSMNNEFKVLDATGGTSTVPTFAASSFNADEWIGYALHCVEDGGGSANLGESRVISDNGTADVTVDRAFTNSPETVEYQIRNSLYDVLPIGFGLGIHNAQIDIESFEDVRDKYLSSASLGRFAIGSEDEINLWEILLENICAPYGILLYVDRTTGKLTATYVGDVPVQDGLDGDYVAVASTQILQMSDIDYIPRAPIGRLKLTVRDVRTKAIRPIVKPHSRAGIDHFGRQVSLDGYEAERVASPGVHGKGHTIPFLIGEKKSSFDGTSLEHLAFTAMFNTRDDVFEFLAPRMVNRLRAETAPASEVNLKLDLSFMLSVQVGTMLAITDTANRNPINPYTAARGWTALVARVLSPTLQFDPPGVQCRVQLLSSITAGRVAPACDVDGKGGAAPEYFTVHYGSGSADFDIDPDDLDWGLFRAGDLVELRDKTGALKEIETIESFGTNEATLPSDANSGRINVVGTIASAIVAGDYLTFQPWSASNTSNMDNYAALADSNETLGASNDAARKYI